MSERITERLWMLAAGLIPLGAYVATLAPTLTLEDSGEFIAGAHVLGVLHPTGYPLWTLIAHAFTWLPFGSIAERVHLSSAVAGAGACAAAFACIRTMGCRRSVAITLAVALGGSRIMWTQSIVAEVYSLNALMVMIATLLVLKWCDDRKPMRLVLLNLTIGLGMGNHHIIALISAGLLTWLLLTNWRGVLAPRTVGLGLAALVAGLSTYAYIPIRSAQNPPLNFDHADRPDALAGLVRHVTRAAYSIETDRFAGTAEDTLTHIGTALWDAATGVTIPVIALALFGAWLGIKSGRRLLVGGIASIFVLNVVVLNFIMTAPSTPLWLFVHRVYYLPAHGALALLAALGLERALVAAKSRGVPAAATAAGVVIIAALPWVVNREYAAYQSDPIARRYIEDFLAGTPRGAGYLATNDTVAFALLYTKLVEGLRPDVDILRDDMGWDGTPPAVIVHDQPVTPASSRRMAMFAGGKNLKLAMTLSGLTWLDRGDSTWRYVEIPHAVVRRPTAPPEYNPFAALVRSQYAVHHAVRGMWLHGEGRTDEAIEAFDDSEAIAPADAFAPYMLALAYERTGVRGERIVPLLRRSLELYDTYFDKAGHGITCPLDRGDIRTALARAEREAGR